MLILTFSPLFSLFQLYVTERINATPHQSVFIFVLSPLLPLALLMSLLASFQEANRIIGIMEEQSRVIQVTSDSAGLSNFGSLFSQSTPDAFLIGLLFYILLNLGVIYIVVRYNSYRSLFLLLLMPVVFSLAYCGVIAVEFVVLHILPVI